MTHPLVKDKDWWVCFDLGCTKNSTSIYSELSNSLILQSVLCIFVPIIVKFVKYASFMILSKTCDFTFLPLYMHLIDIQYLTKTMLELELSDNSLGEIYTSGETTYLDCIKEGSLTIRAKQEGNNNYYAAKRVVKVINIVDKTPVESITSECDLVDVFNVHGVKIKDKVSFKEALNGLHKGIYIINGRKYTKK